MIRSLGQFLILTLLTFMLHPATGQVGDASPPVRVLVATDQVSTGIPRFATAGHPVCSSTGDVVFNVAGRPGQAPTFLRISGDARTHLLYQPVPEIKPFMDLHWAMSPQGDFAALFTDYRQPYRLVTFDRDGRPGRVLETAIPRDTSVRFFAINNRGQMYVQGSTAGSVDDPLKPGFAGLFDSSGTLMKNLTAEAPAVDTSHQGLPEGEVVSGSDGNFYVLGTTTVRVVNSSGVTEQTIAFRKPQPAALANRIDVSSGLLSVEFYSPESKVGGVTQLTSTVLILDLQTGEGRTLYRFSPDLTGSMVCFSKSEGYTMLAVDKQKNVAFDHVPLR